jgi:RNA polymerase sporulation-specific sigma factor
MFKIQATGKKIEKGVSNRFSTWKCGKWGQFSPKHIPPHLLHTLFRGDSMLFQILQQLVFLFLHVGNSGVFPKPLGRKEESDCFQAMAEGDKTAREKLILHNMRLVAHITKKYGQTGQEQEELISIGTIGLVKAVDSFDCSKGARFATYGSRCIENEILMHFRSEKKHGDVVSMEEATQTDGEGNTLTLLDLLDDGTDLSELVQKRMESDRLYRALDTLPEGRQREILVWRYGLYGTAPMTQREVAKRLGISRSYVSRLEKQAMEALRRAYE